MGLFDWFSCKEKEQQEQELSVEEIEALVAPIREKAKDHILFMLGAPVTSIELSEVQIEHAIFYAEKIIDQGSFFNWDEFQILLNEGSLAYAKYMLGRIRVKFGSQEGSPDDGFALINESEIDMERFHKRLGVDY
jgi:hypothetical protein